MIPSESFCHGRHDSLEPVSGDRPMRAIIDTHSVFCVEVLHSRICLAFRVNIVNFVSVDFQFN